MKRFTLLMMTLLFVGMQTMFAQNIKVSGKIVSDDGTPLPGVSVFMDGTTIGTISDANGNYEITVPSDATLNVSYIGMQSQIFTVDGRAKIDIELLQATHSLEEVMVVAYGTAKKASFTGSAEMVKAKQIERRTVSDVSKAIEGTVAGVLTTSGGGQPGSGNAIRIRGYGSLNAASSPLYVVDGIPYDGEINDINPNDIESISVLKDAASASLYGSRASNGVVIITTKRGKEGKAVVSLKATWGITKRAVPDYDKVDAGEYMELAYNSRFNALLNKDGRTEEDARQDALTSYFGLFGGEQYNPFNVPLNQVIDPATGKLVSGLSLKWDEDWLDYALADNPLRQEYQFGVNGGTDKTQYNVSLGYLNEEGLAVHSAFERYSGRVSVDSQVKEWIKTGMNTSFAQTSQNYLMNSGSYYGNIWYVANQMGPVYPVFEHNADGSFVYDNTGNKVYDFSKGRPNAGGRNVIAEQTLDKRQYDVNSLNSNMYLNLGTNDEKYGILKDFKLALNLGVNYSNAQQMIYYNPLYGDGSDSKGILGRYAMNDLSYTFNQILTWNHLYGKSSFDVMLGHEFYSTKEALLGAERTGMPYPGAYELAALSTVSSNDSYSDRARIESYFGRINYNFDEKYFLSTSFRRDGSSRFHKDNRWGNFWSVGAAWQAKKEDFLKDVDWVNNLTLKTSYGTQGNDMLDTYYAWQSFYDLGFANYSYGGAFKTSVENKDLQWEKSSNFNIGIESRLFDRVNFSFEYFNKSTFDLILAKPMALSSGYNSYLENVGDMSNKGFDMTIGVDVINTDKFQWISTLLASHVKNEITKLAEGDEIISGSRIHKVGMALNTFYMPHFLGVNPETGAAEYAMYDTDHNQRFNEDGTPMITTDYNTAQANRRIGGSPIPDLYGSWNNEFRFGNFDFSLLLTYALGGDFLDGNYFDMMETRYYGKAQHKDLLKRWQKPGDITNVEKLAFGNNKVVSDLFLQDASYLSIKNITIGYSLPQRWLNKANINQARIFATADNIYTFTKLKGMDPQASFSGGMDYSYVPVSVISFGVDLKF